MAYLLRSIFKIISELKFNSKNVTANFFCNLLYRFHGEIRRSENFHVLEVDTIAVWTARQCQWKRIHNERFNWRHLNEQKKLILNVSRRPWHWPKNNKKLQPLCTAVNITPALLLWSVTWYTCMQMRSLNFLAFTHRNVIRVCIMLLILIR